jgi:HEAT repeat protein
LIYRLSDVTPEELILLMEQWPSWTEERRRIIARHMADISEENFVVDFSPVLHRLLSDSAAEVRLAALDGLWDTSNMAVVNPIIRLMEADEDLDVRAAAASTLGHFVLMGEWGQISQRVTDRIVEALLVQHRTEGATDRLRGATLESLGNAAHAHVPQLIEDAYYRGSADMQLSAIFAMGRSADSRWLPILFEEMVSPTAEIRVEAAQAVGNIGDSSAVDRLVELLDDEEYEVQLAAVSALGRVGSERAYEILHELANSPDADRLHDAIEEAMEEIDWLGGEIDMALFDWDEDGDEPI